MARSRISTTVDADLLQDSRRAHPGVNDASLMDAALTALLAQSRAAELDAAYVSAYDAHPLDEADDWGDLALFRAAAGAT